MANAGANCATTEARAGTANIPTLAFRIRRAGVRNEVSAQDYDENYYRPGGGGRGWKEAGATVTASGAAPVS